MASLLPPPSSPPPLIHILAVDDSLLDRKVIEKLLLLPSSSSSSSSSSYKVTTVDSGSKALEFLGIDGAPDSAHINVNLIITDYCMPGMTGYELLKRVKESSAFKETPVVIMSSENIPTRIQKCLEEGAKEFIMKPVQIADVERIKAHIQPLGSSSSSMSATSSSSSSSSISSLSTSAPTYHVDQPNVSCNKRKFDSDGFEVQSPERRPRFSGMIFA